MSTTPSPQELLKQRLAALRAPKNTNNNNNNNNNNKAATVDPPPPSVQSTPSPARDEVSIIPDIAPSFSPSASAPPLPLEATDDDVEAYLGSFSTPSTLPSSPSPPPTADRALNAALSSYERIAPAFVSPIEVTFASPRAGPSRTEDEDEALIHRLRDELSIEKAHAEDDEEGVAGWGRRLEGLKGVVADAGNLVGGAGPGEAPDAIDVKDFRDDGDESESEDSEKSVDSDSDTERD